MEEQTSNEITMEKSLEPFAIAIGALCNEWAHLEGAVGRLFLMIGGWDYRLPAAQPMTSCLDMRDKLAAIKVGVLCLGLREDILDIITSSVDFIDVQLRNARNRYVHDIWAGAGDGKNAWKFEIKEREAKRVQGQPRKLRTTGRKTVPLEEVLEVVRDVIAERQHIMDLVGLASHPSDYMIPRPPVKQPPRLHLRRLQEMQRQTDIASAKQKHPLRSSQASHPKAAKREPKKSDAT